MGAPKIDLITPGQRRRLKILQLVAVVATLLVGAVVVVAFVTHWVIGLVVLFFAAPAVNLLVVLFETIVPGD